jgi:hypothetical protein
VEDLAALDRTHIVTCQSIGGEGSPLIGHELDLERIARVTVHDGSDVTGLPAS